MNIIKYNRITFEGGMIEFGHDKGFIGTPNLQVVSNDGVNFSILYEKIIKIEIILQIWCDEELTLIEEIIWAP